MKREHPRLLRLSPGAAPRDGRDEYAPGPPNVFERDDEFPVGVVDGRSEGPFPDQLVEVMVIPVPDVFGPFLAPEGYGLRVDEGVLYRFDGERVVREESDGVEQLAGREARLAHVEPGLLERFDGRRGEASSVRGRRPRRRDVCHEVRVERPVVGEQVLESGDAAGQRKAVAGFHREVDSVPALLVPRAPIRSDEPGPIASVPKELNGGIYTERSHFMPVEDDSPLSVSGRLLEEEDGEGRAVRPNGVVTLRWGLRQFAVEVEIATRCGDVHRDLRDLLGGFEVPDLGLAEIICYFH